jgi:hypothetical protein
VLLLLSAAILAGAILWSGRAIVAEVRAWRTVDARARSLEVLAMFAPGLTACADEPRALLVWQPLAAAARRMCPDEFNALDRAAGGTFPFNRDRLEAAHARWTADWLVWERAHDVEYKLKAAAAEADVTASGGAALMRARLDAVEREKLERYQRRYEEYVRIAKALQGLQTPPG